VERVHTSGWCEMVKDWPNIYVLDPGGNLETVTLSTGDQAQSEDLRHNVP